MRALLITLAAVVLAAHAHAQAPAPTSVLVASPMRIGEARALIDPASFPRVIERGGVLAEVELPSLSRRRFDDQAANETPLNRLQLQGGGEVYCGAGAQSAADAAARAAVRDQTSPAAKIRTACFADTDRDGAADTYYFSTFSNDDLIWLDPGVPLAAPRAWSELPPEHRVLSFVFSGPSGGRVLGDGRLGEGVLEVTPLLRTAEGTRPVRAPLRVPCLEDGRCMALPVAGGFKLMLTNATVEGAATVRLASDAEAQAVVTAIEAVLAARRAGPGKGEGEAETAAPVPAVPVAIHPPSEQR